MYREEGPGGHSRFFLSHLKTAYSISTSRHALAVLFHPQNEKYSQPSHLRNSDIDIRCRVLLPFLAFRLPGRVCMEWSSIGACIPMRASYHHVLSSPSPLSFEVLKPNHRRSFFSKSSICLEDLGSTDRANLHEDITRWRADVMGCLLQLSLFSQVYMPTS